MDIKDFLPEKENIRIYKLKKEIKNIISKILINSKLKSRELFDKVINVDEVILSKDYAYAKIIITVSLNYSEEEAKKITAALNKEKGYIRMLLKKELQIKIIPTLTFLLKEKEDNSIDMLFNSLKIDKSKD